MADIAPKRLSKVAKELNVATTTIIEFLEKQGHEVDGNPNTKITSDVYDLLLQKFQPDKLIKEKTEKVILPDAAKKRPEPELPEETEEILIKSNVISNQPKWEEEEAPKAKKEAEQVKQEKPEEEKKAEIKDKEQESPATEEKQEKKELKVLGKIDLDSFKGKKKKKEEATPAATEEKSIPPKEEIPEPVKEEKSEEKPEPKEEIQEKKPVEQTEEKQIPAKEEKDESAPEKEEAPKEAEEDETKKDEAEQEQVSEEKPEKEKPKEDARGLKIVGKIDLDKLKPKKKPVASTTDPTSIRRKRRKRKKIGGVAEGEAKSSQPQRGTGKPLRDKKPAARSQEVDQKEIQEKIKATLSRLTGQTQKGASKSRLKKKKRDIREQREAQEVTQDTGKIEVTEFITVNELANVMNVAVTEVITVCLNMGVMVSINQRLDAEVITFVADEFGFDVDFKGIDVDEPSLEEQDNPDEIVERAPIVTIMGHVDHGKTSLLDYVRSANVVAGEAGGITQHIGAYEVTVEGDRKITFLDTPGHEAFTAMRARGAKVTDIAIIVIAADDSVMPQTKEAISHAQAAGVPIVFAINKIDRENANPTRIKEQLADMNILVEDWGGKYQSQEISAKQGLNVDQLLEKVLLEAELLELKADPAKRAVGTVIEASLDRGKGIITTILVEAGTLRVGDTLLAGANFGKVKAMFNERGQKVIDAGPATPVQILGFDGAPQAGDKFYSTEDEQQAKEYANKRKQLIREQGLRATKHITLDEIGRRLAIGSFKELNLIVKGDVDGSVEALSDSLLKLSTAEIQINVIHKAVGQISESDVLLASASDAIIIGFQVRPSVQARRLAEQEQIDIRLYSIIYKAIEEVTAAMEGMLAPSIEERILGNVEVREVFKVTKVGTVAGCYVLDGKISRNNKIRLIREGVVAYEGEISALKRYKDDVKEVPAGMECGVSIKNYNDIKVGDVIEAYTTVEVKRTL